MKKLLVAAVLGLAVAGSVKAQGFIQLYSYGTTSTANIRYGQSAGGTTGTLVDGYTIGLYWAVGSTASAVNTLIGGATPTTGGGNGSMVGTGLNLGTGGGSTATLTGGEYGNLSNFITDPSVSASVQTITVVLVAYNGANYETSSIRGHSAAFVMTTTLAPATQANQTGNFADPAGFGLSVVVPEPSTFALAGLGLASLLIFRRRK